MAEAHIIPFGNLDLESDILHIKKGDYRDALDVTPISDGNGNTVSWEAVKGNRFAYGLPLQGVQTKTIRIFFETGTDSYQLDFRRPNNTAIGSVTIAQDLDPTTMINGAVIGIAGILPVGAIVIGNIGQLYVEVSNLDSYGWDWYSNNIGGQIAVFQTITEAIDVGAAGALCPIRFHDHLGDQFVWAATRSDLAEELAITAATSILGLVQLTIPNHGVQNGEAIAIRGVSDSTGLIDGEWIALQAVDGAGNIDADNILLYNSNSTSPFTLTNAVAIVNLYSTGSIGVAVEDPILDSSTYYHLVASKSFNFRKKKGIHPVVEGDINKLSIYFCDGYNPDRALYYYGAYEDAGFTNTINAYTLDTIASESLLTINDFNIDLTFEGFVYGGGNVISGNHRFSITLITEAGGKTSYTDPSGAVNVFSAIPNFSAIDLALHGDNEGVTTNKQIKLKVTGLNPSLYKYVELVDIQYSGGAKVGFTVGKYLITSDTIDITYSGFETGESFDLGLLNLHNANYLTSESMDVLDRRLIRSNLTGEQVRDFTAFFATFKHTLKMKAIDSIGFNNVTQWNENMYNEYLNPSNVFSNMGYMINETYRFMGRVKLKSGYVLPLTFFIDDICFDISATNSGNVFGGGARRLAGLPMYSLDGRTTVNIPYVEWSGFDLNFIVDGKRVLDLVSEILIDVVPMSEKYQEVLAYGFSVTTVRGKFEFAAGGTSPTIISTLIQADYPYTIAVTHRFEWWYMFGQQQWAFPAPGWPGGHITDFGLSALIDPKVVSFYSPDCYLGGKTITQQPLDKIICFDDVLNLPNNNSSVSSVAMAAGFQQFNSVYAEYYNLTPTADTTGYLDYVINDLKFVKKGTHASNFAGQSFALTKKITFEVFPNNAFGNGGGSVLEDFHFADGYAIRCSTNILPPGGHDKGMFYSQYYRPKGKGAKFGAISTTISAPTGAKLLVNSATNPTTSTIPTFGGDVYTQNSFFKLFYPASDSVPSDAQPVDHRGYGIGLRICTQNRVNAQMRYSGNASPIPPEVSCTDWLRSDTVEQRNYSHSYDDNKDVLVRAAFDSTARRESNHFPCRICYSPIKPENSLEDNYRKVLPLDFRDLELRWGAIVHHEVINGELLSWQQRMFLRNYFNSNAILTSKDGSEIITGDGGALTRRGLSISSLGTKHKFGIVKGVSKGGNDVVAWINTEYGCIVRFGYDGTNPISVVHNIKGFIDKNTTWSDIRFSPFDDEGLRGVWNDVRKEYVWTSRAWRTNKGLFNPRKYYLPQDKVYVYDLSQPAQTPMIYVASQVTSAMVASGAIVAIGILDPAYWTQITDPSYRNEFTIAFNELKNGFSTYYSFLPRIYGSWKKNYVSASPFLPNIIFTHNKGDVADWYLFSQVYLRSTPFITMVLNDFPDDKKDFDAIQLNCALTPSNTNIAGNLLDFATEQHISYLTPGEFEFSEETDIGYCSPIKNHSPAVTPDNPSGVNDADTSNLFGRYLLSTYRFSRTAYDKLFSIVIKFSLMARTNRN